MFSNACREELVIILSRLAPRADCTTDTLEYEVQPEGVWWQVMEAAVARSRCVGHDCRWILVFHKAGWCALTHIDPEAITVRESPHRIISVETLQRSQRETLILSIACWLSRFHEEEEDSGVDEIDSLADR